MVFASLSFVQRQIRIEKQTETGGDKEAGVQKGDLQFLYINILFVFVVLCDVGIMFVW